MLQKTKRICKKGHHYLKGSDCPVCPICEEERKSEADIFAGLSAPARRAIQNNHISSLEELSKYSEKEIMKFHGIGKTSIPTLKKLLTDKGLSFRE